MRFGRAFIPVQSLFFCALLLAVPQLLAAQGGIIRGTIVEAGTGRPVSDATVELVDGVSRLAIVMTDSTGAFTLQTASGRDAVLAVSRIGFTTHRRGIRLLGRVDNIGSIQLAPSAVKLDPIDVPLESGVLEDRLKAYMHRRQLGAGYFLNEDRLKTATGAPLSQLLRMVPGIEVTNRATAFGPLVFTNGNQIQNQLSPFRPQGSTPNSQRQIGPCPMQLYIDGRHFSTQDMGIDIILPEDLIGVEIFRSVAELPAEFGGIHARCGVVSVWTRRVPKK